MKTYTAAVVGCGRMGGFIDNGPGQGRSFSFAAAFGLCERTKLVAGADLRAHLLKEWGNQYEVPENKLYGDYRELIDKEKPDIVAVGTHAEDRAEIMIYAAEHGAKAIYAEKALCATTGEAEAIVDAVERNGVVFNMGTGRRWDSGFIKMKEIVDSGDLGQLETMVMCYGGGWIDHGCHVLDLCLLFNNDSPIDWVQATMSNAETGLKGNTLLEDPDGHGIIQFENGVTAHIVYTSHPHEHQLFLSGGYLGVYNSRENWQIRRLDRESGRGLVAEKFPDVDGMNTTLAVIEDLVHSLDTGETPRGGARVAKAGMDITLGFVESHIREGAHVHLPLKDSKVKLARGLAGRPVFFRDGSRHS